MTHNFIIIKPTPELWMKSYCAVHETHIFHQHVWNIQFYHSKSSTKRHTLLLLCPMPTKPAQHMSIAGFIWTKCNSLQSKCRGKLLNHTTQQLLLTANHELHPCLSLALCMLGFSLLQNVGNWEDPVITFVSCHCSAVCNPWRNTSR